MKRRIAFYLAFAICALSIPGDVLAGKHSDVNDALDELVKELSNAGVPRSDIKGIDKELKHMLRKGGHKNDIQRVIIDMWKNGISGKDLKNSVTAWNDLADAGAGHTNSADALSQLLQNGKHEGLHGNRLADMVQQALLEKQGHYGGGGGRQLYELVAELERNGASPQDLLDSRNILQDILIKGGHSDTAQAAILEMLRNGVTGGNFKDSLNAWNDALGRGLDNKRAHDIITGALLDSKAKGMRGRDLASAIQEALRRSK